MGDENTKWVRFLEAHEGWSKGAVQEMTYSMAMNLILDEVVEEITKQQHDKIELKNFQKNIKKKIETQKRNEKIEEEKQLGSFIFDENEVIKEEQFIYPKINGAVGFGFYLEKMCDVYDKKGEFQGQEQRRVPIIITSDKRIIEIGNNLNLAEKIRIRELPSEENYPLRWERISIKQYLQNKISLDTKDFKELFEEMKDFYKDYIYFNSEEWYETQILWDIGTYFFMNFDYYPIMELRGQKGTAKTKVMGISRLFTFNSSEEMSNPSEATLFRETHDKRPTKYIDEAEKLYFFNPKTNHIEADPRAELINSGFKYTGSVPRQEKRGQKFVTVYYRTYSPTMCASINGLYGATEDRAIVHIMTKPQKMIKNWNKEPKENEKTKEMRNKLYIFGLQFHESVKKMYNNIDSSLNPLMHETCEANEENVEYVKNNRIKKLSFRDYNIWTPILSIAKIIDDDLFQRMYSFALKQTNIKMDSSINEGTNDYKIIGILVSLCKGHENRKVYINEILNCWVGDNPPASKTIGNYIDKAGFRDYKDRDRDGTFYTVNNNILKNIIYSTYSTFSSHIDEKICEEKCEEKNYSTFASLNYDIFVENVENDIKIEDFKSTLKQKYFFSEKQFENYLKNALEKGDCFELPKGTLKRNG